MKKLLLVDDHQIILDGIQEILINQNDIEIVATARSGKEALNLMRKNAVDVLCADIEMPEMDGIELARLVRKEYPHTRVLILSMYNRPEFVKKLAEIGVHGYIKKDAGKIELMLAIEQLSKGETYYSQHFTQSLINSQKNAPKVVLTTREKEVLQLIAEGNKTDEIADKLFISFHTVQSHRKNLLGKFGVHNTASLLKEAARNNLL